MGQICVKDAYKRQGLLKALYMKHKAVYESQFEFCVTEISTSNIPSLKAHQNLGFEIIHTFKDHQDEWHVVVWDWKVKT